MDKTSTGTGSSRGVRVAASGTRFSSEDNSDSSAALSTGQLGNSKCE